MWLFRQWLISRALSAVRIEANSQMSSVFALDSLISSVLTSRRVGAQRLSSPIGPLRFVPVCQQNSLLELHYHFELN